MHSRIIASPAYMKTMLDVLAKSNEEDEAKPLITLITDGGTVMANLSTEGLNWKEKHIPNLVIGF